MSNGTSWLERVLIALSESDSNLLRKKNEYNSALTRKLHSAQKCSDKVRLYFWLTIENYLEILELKLTSQQTLF